MNPISTLNTNARRCGMIPAHAIGMYVVCEGVCMSCFVWLSKTLRKHLVTSAVRTAVAIRVRRLIT
ncbi:hypothetical protein HNQ53_000997 [Microbulbifer hydrolyticus]|uniref:Uncharacterized protein n=1 Tax=Microbulbifer hydrolyticus TaxID=48074 RepID=A0AA89PB43_9GAMM|nr:hypothetical protein [Microbulbifer hydrolyticus]